MFVGTSIPRRLAVVTFVGCVENVPITEEQKSSRKKELQLLLTCRANEEKSEVMTQVEWKPAETKEEERKTSNENRRRAARAQDYRDDSSDFTFWTAYFVG